MPGTNPIFTADFVNQMYTLAGVPCGFGDLFEDTPTGYNGCYVNPPAHAFGPNGLLVFNSPVIPPNQGSCIRSTATLNAKLNNLAWLNSATFDIDYFNSNASQLAQSNELFTIDQLIGPTFGGNGLLIAAAPDPGGNTTELVFPSGSHTFLFGTGIIDEEFTLEATIPIIGNNVLTIWDGNPIVGDILGSTINKNVGLTIGGITGFGNGITGFYIKTFAMSYTPPPPAFKAAPYGSLTPVFYNNGLWR